MDYFIINQQQNLYTRLNNSSSNITYQVDIFDSSLNHLITFNQNTNYNNYNFSAGDYFLRVISNTYDPGNEYSLQIQNSYGAPSKVNVTRINSDTGVEGYIDYGYGRFWRVKGFMNIQGKLLDQNGKPVPYTNVEFLTMKVLNNEIRQGSAITDSQGNFVVSITGLDPAVGEFSYSTGRNTHLYDIIPLIARSEGVEIYSDESWLYHFAYSYYN